MVASIPDPESDTGCIHERQRAARQQTPRLDDVARFGDLVAGFAQHVRDHRARQLIIVHDENTHGSLASRKRPRARVCCAE
jgi:hypothetical protein